MSWSWPGLLVLNATKEGKEGKEDKEDKKGEEATKTQTLSTFSGYDIYYNAGVATTKRTHKRY